MNTLIVSEILQALGISYLPVKDDGSKAPALASWKSLQGRQPTSEERMIWFGSADSKWGIAIVAGLVSGKIEVIDFDHKAAEIFGKWMQLVDDQDPNLINKLVIVKTPRKGDGYHVYYRCNEIAGSQHLARETINGKVEILIETKGEASYVTTVGSPGACHPTGGTYEFIEGCDFASIPTITPDEREILHSCARQFDLVPEAVTGEDAGSKHSNRPGDDFNQKAKWADILEPNRWKFAGSRAEVDHWQKPGSIGTGIHATTNHAGLDRLHVFSSSAPPFKAGQMYSKFAAHTFLNHGGDFSAAAKDLAAKGYGSQSAEDTYDWTDSSNWDSPCQFDSTEPPALTPNFFPDSIRDYVLAVVANTQTPVDMATMAALAVLATAAQKKFIVSYDASYKEPVNLYTMSLLPPGSRKSAVLDLFCEPLTLWESKKTRDIAPFIKMQAVEIDIAKQELELLKGKVSKAPDSKAKQPFIDEIQRLMNKETVELKSPRLYVSDTTPEAFVDLLADNDGRCSVISDEGNFLDILTGMYSKDSKANLDVFLKAHSGGSVKVKRKLSETCMDNIAASLGLCIQPQVLAGISYKGQKTLRGKGLFGRILFACPRHNLGTRDVRKRLPISDAVSKRYHAVVNTVLDVRVPKQDSQPRRITLTTDARELWHDFHQLVEAKLCDGAEFADMLDWAGKLPGAVLRICGLVEIVNAIEKKQSLRDDDIEINGSTMEAVIKFAWLLSRHAKLVFSSAGESPALVDARWICDHLSDFMETDKSGAKFVNRSSVHHHSRFNRNSIDFVEKAFKVLAERNIVSPIEGLRTGKRKAKLIHYVNPCWLQSKTAC